MEVLGKSPSLNNLQSGFESLTSVDFKYKLGFFAEQIAKAGIHTEIVSRLDPGDVLKVGSSHYIEMDAAGLKAAQEILGSDPGVPTAKLRKYFDRLLPTPQAALNFIEQNGEAYQGGSCIKFSRYLDERVANCVIFATMTQLACQRDGRECFLMQGTVVLDGDVGALHHAWNIAEQPNSKNDYWNLDIALGCKGKIRDLQIIDKYPILVIDNVAHEYCLY